MASLRFGTSSAPRFALFGPRSGNLIVLVGLVAGCIVPPGGGGGAGCPSIYDGTYNGELQYGWEDDTTNPPSTGTGVVRATLTFACDYVTDDTAQLSITHAMVDDPFFGCNLSGCMPDNMLSFAQLPAQGAVAGAPGFIRVYMPKGNFYTQSDVDVTGNGRIITSKPDPNNRTWYGFGPGASGFPSDTKLAVSYPQWSFSR
jgi:hypothetical protein